MGIIEETLAEFSIEDKACAIEWNDGGWIHIHLGDTRLVFPADKYQAFARIVAEAREELVKMKGLDPEHPIVSAEDA